MDQNISSNDEKLDLTYKQKKKVFCHAEFGQLLRNST